MCHSVVHISLIEKKFTPGFNKKNFFRQIVFLPFGHFVELWRFVFCFVNIHFAHFLHNLCNSFRIGLLPHWLLTKKPQSCWLDYCLNMSGTKTTTRWRCYLGGWDCLDWKLFCPFLVLSGRKHIARGYYFRIINNKFKKNLENKNSGGKNVQFWQFGTFLENIFGPLIWKKPWNKRE